MVSIAVHNCFVDIDEKTITMCTTALKNKLAEAKRKNRLPKVVIPVHGGHSCDMAEIHKLTKFMVTLLKTPLMLLVAITIRVRSAVAGIAM